MWLNNQPLYFASGNQNKVEEVKQLLENVEIKSLADLGPLVEIPETGSTLEENSRIKAEYVVNTFGVAAFADDTGLEVDALDGAPGVYSARYAGPHATSADNIRLLLSNMEGVEERSAQFRTIITLMFNEQMHQFEGIVKGSITKNLSGESGFGYDPVFVPEGCDVTFAEMTASEKNRISHRGIAMRKFVDFLAD